MIWGGDARHNFLKSQLSNLVSEGLSSVNISLDTLCAEKFSSITRRDKKGNFFFPTNFNWFICSMYFGNLKLNFDIYNKK